MLSTSNACHGSSGTSLIKMCSMPLSDSQEASVGSRIAQTWNHHMISSSPPFVRVSVQTGRSIRGRGTEHTIPDGRSCGFIPWQCAGLESSHSHSLSQPYNTRLQFPTTTSAIFSVSVWIYPKVFASQTYSVLAKEPPSPPHTYGGFQTYYCTCLGPPRYTA